MSLYAVVDTNVLISALLAKKSDAATVKFLEAMFRGRFTPLWHDLIIGEYGEVFHRDKFHLQEMSIQKVLCAVKAYGKYVSPSRFTAADAVPTDPDDIIFWQVVMAERQNGAFLITGNIKHFPKRNFVVTPAQMAEMFDW